MLRACNASLPSFRDIQPAAQPLFASPLRLSPELRHLVLAQGDRKLAAWIAVRERAAASGRQQEPAAMPGAANSSSSTAGLSDEQALQQMWQVLSGSPAASVQEFWHAFSHAGSTSSAGAGLEFACALQQ